MDDTAAALDARMQRPQRHRLLQGYPALPLMRRASTSEFALDVRTAAGALTSAEEVTGLTAPHRQAQQSEPAFLQVDRARPLLVGIIPHTQCTPRVSGCGFCTFPHDPANQEARTRTVDAVARDIRRVVGCNKDDLHGRRVAAIYFGGGTANLTASSQLRQLFDLLAERFDVADAEVTLEGIPVLFTSLFNAPLKMLAKLPVRHKRISMGLQTFDAEQLRRMGRETFGDEALVQKVVKGAQAAGLTTSGDLLYNLPDQTEQQMLDDVDRAVAAGLDQVCIYNLVLYEGLGTLWSKDPSLVAKMPAMQAAAARFSALRARLRSAGFVQTTLTNFERADVHATERRFRYEEASFTPETYDALGIGPLSVSTFIDLQQRRAVKLMRRKRVGAVPWSGDDLYFPYEEPDLRLLFVTRSLARMRFSRAMYRALFGDDALAHFPAALAAARSAGLVELDDDHVTLTPPGMFFSDAVVGALAAERAASLRPAAAGLRTLAVLEEPVDFHSGLYASMG